MHDLLIANKSTYIGHAGTPPQPNSTALVQRLIAAGGVVMGKTRMHELAYGVTSISPAFGPVSNPYDVTKIPGGWLRTIPCWHCYSPAESCYC